MNIYESCELEKGSTVFITKTVQNDVKILSTRIYHHKK